MLGNVSRYVLRQLRQADQPRQLTGPPGFALAKEQMTPGHAGQRIDRNVASDCQQERNDRPRLLERRRKRMPGADLAGEPEEVDDEHEFDQQNPPKPKQFNRRLATSKKKPPQSVRHSRAR